MTSFMNYGFFSPCVFVWQFDVSAVKEIVDFKNFDDDRNFLGKNFKIFKTVKKFEFKKPLNGKTC